jgi:hypothetical protein
MTKVSTMPPEILSAMRNMYEEFPEMRVMLMDPDSRVRMNNILVRMIGSREGPSFEDSVRAVMAAGYHVTSAPVPVEPLRASESSRNASRSPAPEKILGSITASSQQGRLLMAFAEAGNDGLTDEQARERAGIDVRSCWWKRCGELRSRGLIEPAENSRGDRVRRTGGAGVARIVSVVTPEGRAVAAVLE